MKKIAFNPFFRLARTWACVLIVPAAMLQNAAAQVIPAGRTIDWTQAGVPGGIPTSRTVFTTVSGLDTNGVNDCSAAIQAAINACPANQVVMLPAGKLLISRTLTIGANTLNFQPGNITLRGAGNTNTMLLNNTSGAAILTGNQNYGQSNNIIISTLQQGASTMAITTTPDFTVGDVLLLQRQDEPATNFALVYNNYGLTNSAIVNGPPLTGQGLWFRTASGDVLAQLVRCTAVSGTNITFWPPLYLTWNNPPGLYAYCRKVWGASASVGIESLAITNTAVNGNTVDFIGTYGSWIKGCRLLGYGGAFLWLNVALNCEVRDCDFSFNNSNPPPGDIEAVQIFQSSACKVENNTFSGYWEQLLMENSASGNVIAYNYFTNGFFGGVASTHYIEADIYANHEAFDAMNLFEGNIMGQFQADNYHGGSGYNTLFRNWIHGMDCPYGIPLTNNIKCIDLNRYSYYFNIVGNVIGSPAVASVPGSVYVAPTNGTFNTPINAMYRLGFPDMGNNSVTVNDVFILYQGAEGSDVFGYPIGYDNNVTATLLREDNYDYVTGGVPDGTATLPPSLVYGTSPPAWWPSANAPPWPPIGPDLSPMTSVIPAEIRYYSYPGSLAAPPAIAAPTGLHIVAPTIPSGPITNITAGLVYWGLIYTTNGTTARDSSGTGNDCTLYNWPAGNSQWVTGQVGTALAFNPTSSEYVDNSSANSLPTASSAPWTIAGWVNSSSFANGMVMFGFGAINSGGSGNERYIIQYDNHVYFWGGSADYDTGVAFNSGAWNFVAATYDGANLSMYLNGSQIGSTAAVTFSSNAAAEIDMGKAGSGQSWQTGFNGEMNDVRIYNVALSAAQVKYLYLDGTY
jgi:hypothetical protein